MSKVVVISSAEQLNSEIQKNRVVVIDFFATWCGPCKTVAPVYERLASQLTEVGNMVFTKVDTDKQQQIARAHNITAMPTFVVIKNGSEIERVQGADPTKLTKVVRTLVSEASEVGGSSGGGGSSTGTDGEWIGGPLPKSYTSLSSEIEVKQVEIMNSKSHLGDARTLISKSQPSGTQSKGKGKAGTSDASSSTTVDWVESDTDEQLMIFIAFQSRIKIFQIQLTSLPPTSDDDDDSDNDEAANRPKCIKLYINSPHILGFDEADSREETQVIDISPSDWKDGTVSLNTKFVKFQTVSTLTVFITEAEGGAESTRIDRIRLIGEAGEKKDLGKLEKVQDE